MGKRKTIVCLETGKQFNSVENAANAIGVSSGFISRQIKAGKPIKGFYYYYAGEMLPDEYRQKIRNRKKKPNYKSRPVICLETGERFESISLVSRMLGISKFGDVLDFFDRHGETLIEKRAGSWHGDSTEVAKASECLQKGLAQFGLTLAQARERYGKREKARYRKWAETVAFFATDCSFLDIANLVDRSVAQVVHEIHDTWYEDYMLGCIDYIASVAYHGGILLKPITTEKEITGHIGDTILSWCEKGQKDDGGNEFRD